jgi:hypothetical protein
METLFYFLKSSTVVDLLILVVILLITVVLVPVGISVAIASRSRMPIFIFLLTALLPLLLALIGTSLRFVSIQQAISQNPEAGSSVIEAARQEAWITTYIGATGAALLALIGFTGLVFKKGNAA